jgi:arylsulfatase
MKALRPLIRATVVGIVVALGASFAPRIGAQEILPFPPTPSASTAGLSMQDSIHKKRVDPARLPKDAPNILIIIMDDVGPGLPSTYGGEVQTPTLDRVAKAGISYNRFHSTAMCSPTRGSLLTGRNHTRIGCGQICEFANDWDGFAGTIPKTAATGSEVLKHYGYKTGAWGKWHNTPAEQTTSAGPFDYWPTSYGFEYFYGFLAGEASQYEPNMVRNLNTSICYCWLRTDNHLIWDLAFLISGLLLMGIGAATTTN